MVMLFPDTADRSWPYVTSNGQYGNFYGTVIREKQRDDYGLHYDCNKQAARIAEELKEAKACLETVDDTWPRDDEEPGQYGACCLKERGASQCNHRTVGCCENPDRKVLGCNCGESREPEFLEDHVRVYHPRLAPKLQVLPKRCFGTTNRCELRGGSVSVRPVGSGGGFGVGLQAGLRGERKRRSRPASPAQGRRAGPPPVHILPASHRYGYYRYYGAAGQGAKTSGGYARRPWTRLDDPIEAYHGLQSTEDNRSPVCGFNS